MARSSTFFLMAFAIILSILTAALAAPRNLVDFHALKDSEPLSMPPSTELISTSDTTTTLDSSLAKRKTKFKDYVSNSPGLNVLDDDKKPVIFLYLDQGTITQFAEPPANGSFCRQEDGLVAFDIQVSITRNTTELQDQNREYIRNRWLRKIDRAITFTMNFPMQTFALTALKPAVYPDNEDMPIADNIIVEAIQKDFNAPYVKQLSPQVVPKVDDLISIADANPGQEQTMRIQRCLPTSCNEKGSYEECMHDEKRIEDALNTKWIGEFHQCLQEMRYFMAEHEWESIHPCVKRQLKHGHMDLKREKCPFLTDCL